MNCEFRKFRASYYNVNIICLQKYKMDENHVEIIIILII